MVLYALNITSPRQKCCNKNTIKTKNYSEENLIYSFHHGIFIFTPSAFHYWEAFGIWQMASSDWDSIVKKNKKKLYWKIFSHVINFPTDFSKKDPKSRAFFFWFSPFLGSGRVPSKKLFRHKTGAEKQIFPLELMMMRWKVSPTDREMLFFIFLFFYKGCDEHRWKSRPAEESFSEKLLKILIASTNNCVDKHRKKRKKRCLSSCSE